MLPNRETNDAGGSWCNLANIVEVYFVYNIAQPQHDLLVRMWMTQHRAFVLRQELLNDIFREYHKCFIQPCDSCFTVEKSPEIVETPLALSLALSQRCAPKWESQTFNMLPNRETNDAGGSWCNLANIVEVYFVYNIAQPQHDLLVRMWMTQHRAFVLRQELLNDIFREYHKCFIQPRDSCFTVEKSPD